MKTQVEIEEMLKQVEADKRLSYPTATVFANAPLALIQTDLEARRSILRSILELQEGS